MHTYQPRPTFCDRVRCPRWLWWPFPPTGPLGGDQHSAGSGGTADRSTLAPGKMAPWTRTPGTPGRGRCGCAARPRRTWPGRIRYSRGLGIPPPPALGGGQHSAGEKAPVMRTQGCDVPPRPDSIFPRVWRPSRHRRSVAAIRSIRAPGERPQRTDSVPGKEPGGCATLTATGLPLLGFSLTPMVW